MPCRWKPLVLPVLGLVLGAVWLPATPAAAAPDAPRWAEGQVIVNFERDATAADRERILAELDAEVIRAYHNIPAALCRLRSGTTLAAVETPRRLPGLRRVEPNGALRLDGVPNDPLFGSQYYLHHTTGQPGVPGADIRAAHAWDVERGSRGIVVGVIDMTINVQHPDLVDHIYTNPGEIPGNGLDDDANGWIDDVHGPEPPAAFGDNHGTACAGIIAAATDNSLGVAGIADVTIMPLRIGWVSNFHDPWIAAVIEVTDYAIDMDVDLISMSAGDTDVEYLALHDIFAAAGQRGIYMAMSAGNYQDLMTQPHYPACFEDIDRIISVSATDMFDNPTFNWHPTWVDLAAPGYVGATCALNGGYTSFGGTSASAPQVAGVLALILSKFGNEPGFDAKARLLATVDVLPALAGKNLTGGRLNAFLAVADPDDVAPAPVAYLEADSVVSNRAVIRWPASGDDGLVGRASLYDLRLSTAPIDEASFAAALPVPGLPYPAGPGTMESVPLAGLAPSTTYHLALRVHDEWGSYHRRLGGDLAANTSALTVATFTTIAAPAIAIAPTTIKVDMARGQNLTRRFTVHNVGGDRLDFSTRVTLGADYVSCAPTGGSLAPGEATGITVALAGGIAPCGRTVWTIAVDSNDPATPVRTVNVVPDILSGALAVPSSTTLDFGVVTAGEARRLTPTLRNEGCEPLQVRGINLAGSGDFAYRGPTPISGPWFTVPPGGAVDLPMEYRPSGLGDDTATITLSTSAIATPVVTLAASGRGATPPRAVFSATTATSRTLYTGAVDTVRLTLSNTGGAGLTFAVGSDLPAWLRIEPAAGTVTGGTSRQLAFAFSAAGRCADEELAVVITTNDVAAPVTTVPARLRVLPGAHLRVSPLAPFTYDQPFQPLYLWNDGCTGYPVTVTGTVPSLSGGIHVTGVIPQTIWPGSYSYVMLHSSDCLDVEGFIRVLSNDPDQPEIVVPFTYYCGPQPEHAAATPDALSTPGTVSAYPNPFNPATTLRLSLGHETTVAACVFDLAGRCVWRHELGARGPGLVEVEWRGQGDGGARLPSGTYFCRFAMGAGRWSSLVKMTLLK